MPEDFVSFLSTWQDLSGAALGGLVSLVVALIVAHIPMRRDDLTAAMLVVSNLVTVRSRHAKLVELAGEQNLSDEHFPYWLSEKLLHSRPKLTPTFDAAAMRVMAIDAHLASHIAMFDLLSRELDEKLDRLHIDFQLQRTEGKPSRSIESVRADAALAAEELERLSVHADCAEKLIVRLILSRRRHWNKLARKIRLSQEERECRAHLRDA